MNDFDIVAMGVDLLESGDVTNEFEDFVVVHFDREQWEEYWTAMNNQGEVK
jgi:hypothetical protein